MKYLLDTGVWLRGVAEPETLPRDVRHLITASEQGFGLSAISLWEIGKKVQIGKLKLPKDLAPWFEDALASNITVLPITPEVVVDAMRLPGFPNRDPADELIVATARVNNLVLMTTDSQLQHYPAVQIRYFNLVQQKSK